MFLVYVIAIWIGAMVIWGLSSRYVRRSDIDRVKSRLLGTSKTKKKATQGPSLIRTEQQASQWSVEIMKRLKVYAGPTHPHEAQQPVAWTGPEALLKAQQAPEAQ